jgi:hypothetical protein
MSSSSVSSLLLLITLLACCGPPPEAPPDVTAQEVLVQPDEREVKLQVAGLTVWVRASLVWRGQAGRRWIMRGRTGGDLGAVHSFIQDDGFGRAAVVGPRSFEVELDAHELNSLLSGLRLFVQVTPRAARTAPATLMVQLGATFTEVRGAKQVDVEPGLLAVNHGGDLRYRGYARARGTITAASSDGEILNLVPAGQGRWAVDFSFERLEAEAASRGRTRFVVHAPERETARVDVVLGVAEAELFRGELEARYPLVSCLPAVQACLDGLPDGVLDYAGCGSYRQVAACNVPARLPELGLIEHDEVTPILEQAARVRDGLPEGKAVYVNPFYVQGTSDTPPPLRQVTRAWRSLLQVQDVADDGPQEPAVWRAELDQFGAGAIVVEAARAVYGDETPLVARLHARDPTAARLLAIELLSSSR